MKLTKAQVMYLNSLATKNWERAQGMLDGINEILGTQYRWLGKRVVFLMTAHGRTEWHDAYCWSD